MYDKLGITFDYDLVITTIPAYPFRRTFQCRIFRNIVRHPGTRANYPASTFHFFPVFVNYVSVRCHTAGVFGPA
jgi:hypothetical protein